MTAFTEFLPEIRPLLPTATAMAVTRSARRTTRDFFRKVWAYRAPFFSAAFTPVDQLPPEDVPAAGAAVGALAPDFGTVFADWYAYGIELYTMAWMTHGGQPVAPSSQTDGLLNPQRAGWFIVPPYRIYLTFAPSGVLQGEVVVIPRYDATAIPDALFARYYDVLVNGILSDLYATESAAYFDPNKSAYRGAQYAAAVEDAVRHVTGDHMFKPTVTAYGGI